MLIHGNHWGLWDLFNAFRKGKCSMLWVLNLSAVEYFIFPFQKILGLIDIGPLSLIWIFWLLLLFLLPTTWFVYSHFCPNLRARDVQSMSMCLLPLNFPLWLVLLLDGRVVYIVHWCSLSHMLFILPKLYFPLLSSCFHIFSFMFFPLGLSFYWLSIWTFMFEVFSSLQM